MGTPWVARHGLTSAQYQAEFDKLVAAGYRLTDVNGFSVNDTPYFAGIWEKISGPAWQARHGLSSADYQKAFDDLVKQGYRLTRVSGYTVNGRDRYAAIWTQGGSEPWVARHGLTSAQYQAEFEQRVKEGYRLADVTGYTVDKSPRFAAIFVKSAGPAWQARHGLTGAQYQATFDQLVKEGYRLYRLSGYSIEDSPRFACLFLKASGPSWVARHGMSSHEYQTEFDNRFYQGYRLKDVTGYEQDGKARYGALWHSTAMSDADLALIDKKVKAYMTSNGVPGVSLAITKNERLVYAEGYGNADASTGEKVGPRHRFRIASVSKPITGVAIMDLVEKGKLTLDSKVFGSGAILGTTYGTKPYGDRVKAITVRHLLNHTSGFTNDGGDPMFFDASLTQAKIIAWMLDNRPPTSTPGTKYEYSNFGYCVLGRIIEKVTGQTYESALQNGILKESGITQMEIGGSTAAQRKPWEVAYYGGSPYSLLPERMDAHGGWIATPIDLLRLTARVDGFNKKTDILTAASETKLTTGSTPNPSYGLGWSVDSAQRGHNGAMSGTLAILSRRNDGFSFAAACNTWPEGDKWASELKTMLDEIVTGVTAWPDHDLF